MSAYRDLIVEPRPAFDLTIRLFRPAFVLVPWAILAIAFAIAKLNTHRIEVRCGELDCEVVETRAGFELARRSVTGEGAIGLRPRDDGGADAMLGDRWLVTIPHELGEIAYGAFVRRGERTATIVRPFDSSPWRVAAYLLVPVSAALLWFGRRRVVVDYEEGMLYLHFQEAPLRRVVGIHYNADAQIVVTLDDGDQRVLFPVGRNDREARRNFCAIRDAIHAGDDDYSKNF